ncbi:unnamed protein product, partial [Brugia pahangi]|uniref:Secreted protein n=1 Tax=Brugia pahangi TaxID=6280 RepID=A0A0N4TGC6_BRUPA
HFTLLIFTGPVLFYIFLCYSFFLLLFSTFKIYNKKWKKDIVYLYQFNRASSSPNISPFCFKLETWLRANELKHEVGCICIKISSLNLRNVCFIFIVRRFYLI